MAKKQTFTEKAKKGGAVDTISVKVLRWNVSEERGGSLRLKESFVRVKDLNDLNTI